MYRDREHAGEILADLVLQAADKGAVVMAIPRGGVAVAAPIAWRLQVPIYPLVTRKIGHPANKEVAIGSLMPDGTTLADYPALAQAGISEEQFRKLAGLEQDELRRRLVKYAGSIQPPKVQDGVIVLVDDGIATGYTVRAAIDWLVAQKPSRIIVAVPVAPLDVIQELRQKVEVICPVQAENFVAVGMYYQEFGDTSDQEMKELLAAKQGEVSDESSSLSQAVRTVPGQCAGTGDRRGSRDDCPRNFYSYLRV